MHLLSSWGKISQQLQQKSSPTTVMTTTSSSLRRFHRRNIRLCPPYCLFSHIWDPLHLDLRTKENKHTHKINLKIPNRERKHDWNREEYPNEKGIHLVHKYVIHINLHIHLGIEFSSSFHPWSTTFVAMYPPQGRVQVEALQAAETALSSPTRRAPQPSACDCRTSLEWTAETREVVVASCNRGRERGWQRTRWKGRADEIRKKKKEKFLL